LGAINKQTSTAPTALTKNHVTEHFDCGIPTLNEWLKKRALKNEKEGASRTYVSCEDDKVIAYYAIATGAIRQKDANGHIRRNMPDPIPVIILGRLAVDITWQGQGLGSDMLSDAIKRTLQAANIVGTRAFIVHALSDEAKQFYEKHGFRPSPTDPMNLMISMKEAKANL